MPTGKEVEVEVEVEAGAAAVAVLVWLASVAWCAWLDRAGRPGPAEVVLRRVTYADRGRSVATVGEAR